MKVLAKVTLVVNKTEYAPDTEVEIPDNTEAESLIERGFALAIGKKENKTTYPATTSSKPDNSQKSEKTAANNSKSDKNNQKTDNKSKKEIDNSGSTVSQSGGQPV